MVARGRSALATHFRPLPTPSHSLSWRRRRRKRNKRGGEADGGGAEDRGRAGRCECHQEVRAHPLRAYLEGMGLDGVTGGYGFITKAIRTYAAETAPSPDSAKLLFEISGRLVPAMSAPSPTLLYQMSVAPGAEEEALGFFKSFMASLRTNDIHQLSALSTPRVSFVQLKDSMGSAAQEVRLQLQEHQSEVMSELNSLKTSFASGQQGLKDSLARNHKETLGLKTAMLKNQHASAYIKTALMDNQQTTSYIRMTVQQLYVDSRRVTLLKILGYAGIISLGQMTWNWGVGEYLIKKANEVRNSPPPPPSSPIPPYSIPLPC